MLNRYALADAAARTTRRIGGVILIGVLSAPQAIYAQPPYDRQNRYDPYESRDPYQRLPRLEAGTFITVRATQPIDTDRRDGRVFSGVVERDVWDDYRRLAVPAIPRGSPVELVVRTARDGDLILDLDSVIVDGQRYAVTATSDRIENRDRIDRRDQGAVMIGGGAVLGTIIGAIAGGGKGAAIGAAAGAAAGAAGLLTQGRVVRVPAGSVLTFRLERELTIGVTDEGFSRGRWHYHRD